MAIQFAQNGAHVAISARRKDRLEKVLREISDTGVRGVALKCDVSDDSEVQQTIQDIVAEFGQIDIVVANAGFGVGGKIEELDAEDWRRQFEVNVVGLASTIKHSLPHLKKTKGNIVLMSSVASMIFSKGTGAYSASKAAVRTIGQTLNAELKGTGVACTTIHPGFVESEIGQVDNKGQYREDWEDRRPRKLMWPTDKAVRMMLKAIRKRKRSVVVTGHGKVLAFFGRHFPGLVHLVMSRK